MALPRLFVIGDSISIQYGPYLEAFTRGTYVYARKSGEEAALRNLDVPAGANGGDSGMVLAYLRAVHAGGGLGADVLMLNCGLHDIKCAAADAPRQVALPQYEENLRQIVTLAGALAPRVRWVRTTPVDETLHNDGRKGFHRYNADVDAYNAVADAVMRAAGVPLFDLHAFTANLPDPGITDGVHFAEPTRALQAAFLAGALCAEAPCG